MTGAVGAYDAGLKLGGNIDDSITDAALAEDLRYAIAHDAADVALQTAVALELQTTSDITGAVGAEDAGLKLGGGLG